MSLERAFNKRIIWLVMGKKIIEEAEKEEDQPKKEWFLAWGMKELKKFFKKKDKKSDWTHDTFTPSPSQSPQENSWSHFTNTDNQEDR